MSSTSDASGAGQLTSEYWLSRRNHLFWASCTALIVTAMSFAIRGDLIAPLGQQFGLTKEQIGWVISTAFWGFTLAMIIGGPLCDVLGMGRILALAFVGHALGIFLTIFARDFWTLFISTLIFGIANGFVEAACNPLITTMFPDQKIKRLSMFHVWFPGGIVIGGVVAYAITKLAVGQSWESHAWQIKMASMLIPLIIYGIMFIGRKFPATERAASGISMEDMFKECIRPAFLMFVVCMLMTAVTELGPQQWFPNILTLTTGVTGILFLIWITGLMAVGRNFAGLIVHNISPIALLICSAAFSLVGLYMISGANSAGPAFFSATLFAIGVCFFWPTMLGVVSERFPRTGALGLAIMGGAGMLASSFAQPVIGGKFDQVTQQEIISVMSDWKPSVDAWMAKQTKDNTLNTEWAELSKLTPATASAKAPELVKFLGDVMKASGDMKEKGDTTQADLLQPAANAWALAQKDGGSAAIRQVVVLPIILLVVFISIFLYDKSKGGYQKQMLHQEQTEA